MKGNNTLELNHATMQQALEYWLNETQFKAPVQVSKISIKRDGLTMHFRREYSGPTSRSGSA